MPKNRLRTEPGCVVLIVHDPIQPPELDAPTVQDAKVLARRVRDVVAAGVEQHRLASEVGPRGGPV